ncbi:hypothetical protein C8F04DRAFT_1102963 [Mycena alexandri]|uniref:Uncharacterized protein n=1 Tax=Mycena alexandri TaxID=1745969 RepID=A0AAD6X3A4_9AGAR|nr:hypothetical protein C8F04DRAFT_1102963 [Mycena alexandri]
MPVDSMMAVEEDATLHKAKQMFLQHLEEVDTSEGSTNTLVLKFQLDPEVESALDAFVTEHGCSMQSRVISREEQDKLDKRRKSCTQYTHFMVTPEAQKAYLKDRKLPPSPSKASPKKTTTPNKATTTPKKGTTTPKKAVTTPKIAASRSPAKSPRKVNDKIVKKPVVKGQGTPESEDSNARPASEDVYDEKDVVKIPVGKFDDLCGRLASALLLLPTTDIARATESRETLLEVAHEMRQLRPLKRSANDEDKGEGSSSHAKAKKRRL